MPEALDHAPPLPEPPPRAAHDVARRTLLRRLMDVVALPASRASVQDRAIAGDLLLEMLIESDVAARELCARRLREMSQAPRRLLRFLALDAPHVSDALLRENRAFDDSDLAYIVAHGGPSHRLAVASRRDIGPCVASAIADSGDPDAMRQLALNTQSKLSDHAVDVMVSASRTIPCLPALLIEREELRPAHALAMFWWCDAAGRRQILTRFSAERAMLIEHCADIYKLAAAESWSDPVVRKAMQVIERRQRVRLAEGQETLEAAVLAARERGMDRAALQEIAALSGVKAATAERIFSDKGGEGVAILCKATGLKRAWLRHMWRALGRPLGDADTPDPAFQRVADLYETTSVARAQTVLRYWNWSLSSAYSPDMIDGGESADPLAARTEAALSPAAPARFAGRA